MKSIKNIIYEIDGNTLFINISEKVQIKYKDISSIICEKEILEYLINLFCIIDEWNREYINKKNIDGSNWRLSIIYYNGNKEEYVGQSSYPNNFEAFERLNQKLIDKVYNE